MAEYRVMRFNQHVHGSVRLSRWSKAIRREYDHRCAVCGTTSKLEAHHIIFKRSYPGLKYVMNNGISLCDTHHDEAHLQIPDGRSGLHNMGSWEYSHGLLGPGLYGSGYSLEAGPFAPPSLELAESSKKYLDRKQARDEARGH